ncbi:hypothetical protein Tco_1455956 [Tanacetum coccineum]
MNVNPIPTTRIHKDHPKEQIIGDPLSAHAKPRRMNQSSHNMLWFQVIPKVSHLHAMKRIFKYLKGQHKLGLWYHRDSPFDLEAFSDSDYAGASLDRKSTIGGKNIGGMVYSQIVDFLNASSTIRCSPMSQEARGYHCSDSQRGTNTFFPRSPPSEVTTPRRMSLVINKLKKKVKRLEKKQRERTLGMKLFKIGTSKRKSLDKEDVSKQGRNLKTRPMFEEGDFDDDFDDIDDMVNEAMENVEGDILNQEHLQQLLQLHLKMRILLLLKHLSTRILPTIDPKDKGKGIMQESEKPPKNPIKAQIQRKEIVEQEAKDVALIEQIKDIQARIDADELLAERFQQEEREQFTIEEKSRMLVEMIAKKEKKLFEREQEWINDFVPMDSEAIKDNRKKIVARKRTGEKLDDESVKRQKIEDDAEKEELRAYLE